jgi:hypothetical protein
MIESEKQKLLTNILEKITAYFPTDDNRLDRDYIWEQCKIIRNIFIEKMYAEDKRNIEDFFARLILPVKEYDNTATIVNPNYDQNDPNNDEELLVNPDYEPDFPTLSRVHLPNLINLQGNIRFLGPEDRSDEYTRLSFDSFFHLQGRDFTSERTFYLPFKDRAFFNNVPANGDTEYTNLEAWLLLEDPEDDPEWNCDEHTLVPKKYQLLLEDMVSDNILKYARGGILSRLNDATDLEVGQEK